MKKLIKAVVIGYAVLWIADSVKSAFKDNEINSLDDIKKFLKDKL
jgi:hypothetical protein